MRPAAPVLSCLGVLPISGLPICIVNLLALVLHQKPAGFFVYMIN